MTETTTLSAAEIEQRTTLSQFREAFRALARERKLTSMDMIAYNIMRGHPADRGFSPITNTNKLANGTSTWYGLQFAKNGLVWKLEDRSKQAFIDRFKPSITDDNLTKLRAGVK